MPHSDPSNDGDSPQAPHKASTAKKGLDAAGATNHSTTTTGTSGDVAGPTPKSAPAVAANLRHRTMAKKTEPPTLLADFLMGRQSPARKAAERERRRSLEAVKAELRQEVRQTQLRKLQPHGVKDRVKAWQRANAGAIEEGDPNDAATEPPETAFEGEDVPSPTEEDRVRIKMRQKKRSTSKSKPMINVTGPGDEAERSTSRPPPKRRVVSDDNWVKPKVKRSPQRKVSPRMRKSASPNPIPKDFVLRSAPAQVSNKVKAWAEKIQPSENPSSKTHRYSKSAGSRSRADDDGMDGGSDMGSDMDRSTSHKTARLQRRPKSDVADGIRIKPVRKKDQTAESSSSSTIPSTSTIPDDGIRVKAMDDGIRMQAMDEDASTIPSVSSRSGGVGESPRLLKPARLVRPASKPKNTLSVPTGKEAAGLTRASATLTGNSASKAGTGPTATIDDLNSLLETPTKHSGSRGKSSAKQHARPRPEEARTGVNDQQDYSDEESALNSANLVSELSLANRSVADIPGYIPFGQSAFSELDLSHYGNLKSRPKRAKPDRNTSIKGMSVLKKVVEEGKKIIQDMNESPKTIATNNPPSIEQWLFKTEDPFVDTKPKDETLQPPAPKKVEKAWAEENKAKRTASRELEPDQTLSANKGQRGAQDSQSTPVQEAPKITTPTRTAKERSQSSGGLQRRRATRGSSSPLKAATKRPFIGVLKEAFRGESSPHINPPKPYQGYQEQKFEEEDWSSGYDTASDLRSSLLSDETSTPSKDFTEQPAEDIGMPHMPGPRFRPPTKGRELSTILSEENSSNVSTDLSSGHTESTLTQSTALTKDSDLSRPHRKPSGLKRRLTKHSDLVSALSLPESADAPQHMKSGRSRPSVRKARDGEAVSATEILQEFGDDENIYLRELKTLVDGVVPVLLSQVVHASNASAVFGSPRAAGADSMSKSVLAMGVALEKLKNAHKRAPLKDLRRVIDWAHGVVPIYNSYLKAWRLGFQGLIVNLAPRDEPNADADSLLNALPRNENGDVLNSDGGPVDVAHLLKRPLVRVKHMVKLLRCIDGMLTTPNSHELVRDFEALQDLARRRYREETARMIDEEASNTDVSRTRDLRNLDAADKTIIDPTLQVAAKDIFSLNLAHSNGQRLECQVELIHRDSVSHPGAAQDLLIREVGGDNGRRSYLLFPPISLSCISARTSEGNLDMILMVRGSYMNQQWHELLTVSADNEDQILDWLDILPLDPIPPRQPEPSVAGDMEDEPLRNMQQVPVGASFSPLTRPGLSKPRSLTPERPTTRSERPSPSLFDQSSPAQSRAHKAAASLESPTAGKSQPTQDSDRSRPLTSSMRPDPAALERRDPNAGTVREDGAPTPPIHRTFSPIPEEGEESKSNLSPPEDLKSSKRVSRRGSSPLKHEYCPSDISSGSDTASLTQGSDSESSDDEIESVDIPETELGVSLSRDEDQLSAVPEMPTDSVCSLTPSNSASQAGLHGHKTSSDANAARYMATISKWSDKGLWKEISSSPCSVIVTAGLIEAYVVKPDQAGAQAERPHIALDLTPLVLIRQSTAVDLEIRSSVQPHSKMHEHLSGGNFRFRCHTGPECFSLYMSVHHARLNNQKFIELENEARFKSFGERKPAREDGDTSSRRRTWFGRKNSYRSSVRAPTQSQDGLSTTPSSNPSASSFLKRLTVAGSLSFNLARSSVDKYSRAGSNSLYTSGSSSSGTPPRSPSISISNGMSSVPSNLTSDNIRIRLHLLVGAAKWDDLGNCILQVRRPPPGWHQALRADHGLEKRVTVTTLPRKESEKPIIMLDAVLGSACFQPMGSRGVVCGVWEELKTGGDGVVAEAPVTGGTGGSVKKWCFQFASVMEAGWVLRLVHQEVVTA